jgi:hypothetical protein
MERLKATLNKQVPTRTQKESCKANFEKNKEEKKEWYRQHYQKNKHIRNEAIQCECGCMISKYH